MVINKQLLKENPYGVINRTQLNWFKRNPLRGINKWLSTNNIGAVTHRIATHRAPLREPLALVPLRAPLELVPPMG